MTPKSKRKTAPSGPPITLSQAKKQLNLEDVFTDDDDLIESLVLAATSIHEKFTNRQLMKATWQLVMNSWLYDSDYCLQLPIGPVQSITSVKYYNSSNAETTLPSLEYRLNNYDDLAVVELFGTLPTVYDRTDAVIIEYVAGAEGTTDSDQQANIDELDKRIIKALLTDLYEYRGDNNTGNLYQVSMKIEYLMSLRKLHPKVFFEHA